MQATASTQPAVARPLSASVEHSLSPSTQYELATHPSDSHDCCDGNMSQCPMAQCAGAYYANISGAIASSITRPKVHFQTLRTGAPRHPSSTLFRPPILS